MKLYFFIFEAEPQPENPVIAHVSRAVVHMWIVSETLQQARDTALQSLLTDAWKVTEEKAGYLPTPGQIEQLGEEEASQYHTARSEGIHAKFHYWHRSE